MDHPRTMATGKSERKKAPRAQVVKHSLLSVNQGQAEGCQCWGKDRSRSKVSIKILILYLKECANAVASK